MAEDDGILDDVGLVARLDELIQEGIEQNTGRITIIDRGAIFPWVYKGRGMPPLPKGTNHYKNVVTYCTENEWGVWYKHDKDGHCMVLKPHYRRLLTEGGERDKKVS